MSSLARIAAVALALSLGPVAGFSIDTGTRPLDADTVQDADAFHAVEVLSPTICTTGGSDDAVNISHQGPSTSTYTIAPVADNGFKTSITDKDITEGQNSTVILDDAGRTEGTYESNVSLTTGISPDEGEGQITMTRTVTIEVVLC